MPAKTNTPRTPEPLDMAQNFPPPPDPSPKPKRETSPKPKGCRFTPFGCKHEGKEKGHLDKEPVFHLSILCDSVSNVIKPETLLLHRTMEDMMNKMDKIYIRHDRLNKEYGPHLVWKVHGWEEKYNSAKHGINTVITSPPFLTGRHGYVMVASLCPYGDSKVRGKFMSVFVSIAKGPFDEVCQWPFSHKVHFSLLDQQENLGKRKDVPYQLKPNPIKANLMFLGRPRKERNASFGAQKFVDLGLLKSFDYVKDDTLFIKINVDPSNMNRI